MPAPPAVDPPESKLSNASIILSLCLPDVGFKTTPAAPA